MSRPSHRPYYGSGYAGVGFRGVGGHLLKEFPRVTEPPAAAAATLTYGPHLVSLMAAGPDGLRVASCPVCVTPALVPHSAGGWFPIRCTACGTEYHASDGTPPPAEPPPPPVSSLASVLEKLEKVRVHKPLSPPSAVPPAFPAELARWNLGRWVASGEPERWVAARRGTWGETDFMALIESLRVSGYWPVEVPAVRRAIDDATARYRAKAAPPLPPPPRSALDIPRRRDRERDALRRWENVWLILFALPWLVGAFAGIVYALSKRFGW